MAIPLSLVAELPGDLSDADLLLIEMLPLVFCLDVGLWLPDKELLRLLGRPLLSLLIMLLQDEKVHRHVPIVDGQ